MTKAELFEYLRKFHDKKTTLSIAKKLAENPEDLISLIEFTFHPKHEIGFRAAWVLEHCVMMSFETLKANMQMFLDSYLNQTNDSCQRHYTKILMYLVESRSRRSALDGYDLESLIDKTFEWLIDSKTPVAVRVNCMDILYCLRDTADWVAEELGAQIEFLMKDGTAAIQARGKKILKKLGGAG